LEPGGRPLDCGGGLLSMVLAGGPRFGRGARMNSSQILHERI